MPSIVADELTHLDFEIWLLYGTSSRCRNVAKTGFGPWKSVDTVCRFEHGQARGLLLPGVATDHGFDAPTFLQQVSLKAGLPRDGLEG